MLISKQKYSFNKRPNNNNILIKCTSGAKHVNMYNAGFHSTCTFEAVTVALTVRSGVHTLGTMNCLFFFLAMRM